MAIGPRLDLRQQQALVMTPQLQQAIRLLQMSNLEVQLWVEREVDQNPLLEREDGGGQDHAGAEKPAPTNDSPELSPPVDDKAEDAIVERATEALDTDSESVWGTADEAGGGGDASWRGLSRRGSSSDEDMSDVDNVAAKEMSLRDHLLGQINVDVIDAPDRLIATHLLDTLDDSGYLTGDLAQIGQQLGCDKAKLDDILAQLQTLDPPGVFARDLAECLKIQLRESGRLTPKLERLLQHLDLLGRRDFTVLRRLCHVDSDELAEMVAAIRTLNPKPGAVFDQPVAQPVTPDVIVRPRAGGDWTVELNNDTLPRVLINNRYYAVISKRAKSKPEREYVAERLQSASWLVRALQQRAETILRVAITLVKEQGGFLNHGIQHLRPLTLGHVARILEIHESTVSRVVNNKYMATPRGVFAMRYFFDSAIGQQDAGEVMSAEALRFKIKALIEREASDDVLSDDRIVDILRRDGCGVARRTVTKYRELLQIPSSVQRRRAKLLHSQAS
ncbi:MAG TPA: RNA polymerase factor sigma-54 [Alphaproteobacteria bacterium]